MDKSLDRKLAAIHANPNCREFILAAAFGPSFGAMETTTDGALRAEADKAMPFFRSELAKYAQIVKKAGIEAQ